MHLSFLRAILRPAWQGCQGLKQDHCKRFSFQFLAFLDTWNAAFCSARLAGFQDRCIVYIARACARV
jgi:hypothetical protein